MAVDVRTIASGISTSATVSATSDGTPVAGDLALIIHGNDFYSLATMPAPTGTNLGAITQVVGATADGGTNAAHIKTYWAVVQANGAVSASVTETGSADEDKSIVIFVLSGADTTTPIDDSAGNAGAATTSQDAPSTSPATATAYLVCVVHSGGGAATASYATPGSMTERYELHQGGLSSVGATEQLAASGATGVRTFVAANAIPFGAVSVAIRTAANIFNERGVVSAVGSVAGSQVKRVALASVGVGCGVPRATERPIASRLGAVIGVVTDRGAARHLGSQVGAVVAAALPRGLAQHRVVKTGLALGVALVRHATGSLTTALRIRLSGRESNVHLAGREPPTTFSGREAGTP